ncbi:MAG: hypothetical protein CL908_12680 [Deltaproteobacteria bacterium]|nr:hypothetical protein [Deltaproteobacteria bacterium]
MTTRIESPADTPPEVYQYWHKRWCEILSEEHREGILEAGLPGLSFTERVPDAPDGKGYFSYAFDAEGRLDFMEGEGRAVAEYASYEFGFRLLSDPNLDGAKHMEDGSFRIVSEPEHWARLMSLMPILRETCHRTIEEAEKKFDLELPKYW